MEKDELVAQGYTINETVRWLPYTIKHSIEINAAPYLLARKCLYVVGLQFFISILHSVFSRVVVGYEEEPSIGSFMGKDIPLNIFDSGRVDFSWIQETFSNISESLTTWIGTHGHENYSEPAIGEVMHYAVCLHFRWQWIGFPSLLAILTMVFFTTTVCSKTTNCFPAWKASFLPWLMCGPGSATILNEDELEETTDEIDEMESKSKEVTITWKSMSRPNLEVLD
ncbi:hypothetical protein F5Y10DRAFT_246144 [Nemania abortiva]|nr:hypothetical protein F5Y10DRAFT_246144 [Nemania abortiva]